MLSHTDFANNIPVPYIVANAIQTYEQQFDFNELDKRLFLIQRFTS
jgi:hypothetical protein